MNKDLSLWEMIETSNDRINAKGLPTLAEGERFTLFGMYLGVLCSGNSRKGGIVHYSFYIEGSRQPIMIPAKAAGENRAHDVLKNILKVK